MLEAYHPSEDVITHMQNAAAAFNDLLECLNEIRLRTAYKITIDELSALTDNGYFDLRRDDARRFLSTLPAADPDKVFKCTDPSTNQWVRKEKEGYTALARFPLQDVPQAAPPVDACSHRPVTPHPHIQRMVRNGLRSLERVRKRPQPILQRLNLLQ
ncbi:MAG TPA: hypothetical protein VKP65_07735 [Rhodothermales bacterium]|nr:hypothetical protein [Rhodothermales bacterium]